MYIYVLFFFLRALDLPIHNQEKRLLSFSLCIDRNIISLLFGIDTQIGKSNGNICHAVKFLRTFFFLRKEKKKGGQNVRVTMRQD